MVCRIRLSFGIWTFSGAWPGAHLDTAAGTPDLSGSDPCEPTRCRINPAFRLASLSLSATVSQCAGVCWDLIRAVTTQGYRDPPRAASQERAQGGVGRSEAFAGISFAP